MSEQRTLLCDTAEAVFAEAVVEGIAPIETAGFVQLLVSEADGGFGGDWGDVFAVLRLAGAKVPHLPVGELLVGGDVSRPIGAFIRVAQAAGAMDAALAMSIDYVNTRQQFGKPLGKFQAVQQVLAIFATEAAAVNVAGAAAATALDKAGGDANAALFEIASAKLRTNKAIGQATSIAHQVHGAIGFTQEYELHKLTGPLLDWRSDHGNDAFWADVLGAMASKLGGAGLWQEVTRRG
ncbi:acyl-CoA dehydrogenase family protein [uncultured Sphingorhabdus sp.]|uniref:acyl-CoA dehydrogenase family protein n=1 Tax=uncultured Sphingorhabdus sp. TaxID=1686106 RepID=UPI0026137253|nr:acyl-CoA dehydrogenase family protein [uncultured Sphingorhabdus sp.]HMS21232.1 acyl-CoA dehydrogenase family protein [Sphingorhabdus sp.]